MKQRLSFSQMKFRPIVTPHESCCARPTLRNVLVQDKVNGILVSHHEVKEVSPAENFKGFKYEDFALSNLLAIGAAPTNFVQLFDTNFDRVIDGVSAFENEFSRVESFNAVSSLVASPVSSPVASPVSSPAAEPTAASVS